MAEQTAAEKKKADEAAKAAQEAAAKSAEEKAADQPSDAEIAAQNQASVTTPGVPAPAAAVEDGEEAQAAREDAISVASHLGSLDRESLVALDMAVAAALRNKGQEPAVAAPTTAELARMLPTNDKATEDLDVGKALASLKKNDVDVKESQVIKVAVLQATGLGDKHIGPKYVKVITADGQKHYASI